MTCPSELDLERWLLAAAPAELARHVDGCAPCRARVEAMRRAGEEFEREVFPATVEAVLERSRRRPRRARWAALAALPVAAAAAALLVLRPAGDYVGSKGGGLSLAVFVQGPDGARAASDGELVPAASAVRFRVHPARGCRLWIVSVDGGGQVSRLYPAAGEAAVAPAGALPGGAVLDGRPGPERIFAVCTERPLPFAEVERAARAAAGSGEAGVRGAREMAGLPGAAQATLLLEKRP